MQAKDYRRLATLSFEGTLTAKAKMAMIALKAMQNRK
jgi:hypothetical protein